MKNFRKKKRVLCVSLILFVLVGMSVIQGCGGGGDGEPYYEPPPRLSTIEGIAYFPYYEGTPEPSYYLNENYDIQVTLHADDGSPIEDQTTGDSGHYRFDDIEPGYYYVTAFARVYDENEDIWNIYDAESLDIDVRGDELFVVDMYLEYVGST